MDVFWVTIALKAASSEEAERAVEESKLGGRIVQVDFEPPQGALIVGDLREDD